MDPIFTSNFDAKRASVSVSVIQDLVMSRNRNDASAYSKTIAAPIYKFSSDIATMNKYKHDFDYLVEKRICDPHKNDKDTLVYLSIMMQNSPYPLYLLCLYYQDKKDSYMQAQGLLRKISRPDSNLYLGDLSQSNSERIMLYKRAYNESDPTSRYIRSLAAKRIALLLNGPEAAEWNRKAEEAMKYYQESYDNPL